jgi:hypothetical protein
MFTPTKLVVESQGGGGQFTPSSCSPTSPSQFGGNKKILPFFNESTCRVETSADNANFLFFGMKPDKPCIAVPARHMPDLCNSLYNAQEKVKMTAPVKGNDTVVASYPLFTTDDKAEVVVDVQTYNGNCSIWLKKFKTVAGQRRGCPGWVILNDMDAQTLHNWYTKC